MNIAYHTPICAPSGTPAWAARLHGALRLLALLLLFPPIGAMAQNVTTNGGSGLATSYSSLADAINALNAATVNSPVIITLNVDQTTPQGGYVITASGTAANSITLRGAGANPTVTVTAAVPVTGSTHDAIFEIRGGDHITIENLRMREHAATPVYTSVTNNMTEWGVALTLASTSNGPLNCTVSNNDIALDRLYPTSFGVYANAWHGAETTATTVSLSAPATMPAAYSCSGLVVRSNAISSVNIGIAVVGARSASSNPQAVNAYNDNITIGGPNPADGNIISNFGSTGAPGGAGATGIQAGQNAITLRNTRNYVISHNDITSFEQFNGGVLRGIYVDNLTTGSGNPTEPAGVTTQVIDNNRISLRQFTSGNAIQALYVHFNTNNNNAGSSLSISGNEFHNTDHTNAQATASGAVTFISCNSASRSHNIDNNLFTDLQVKTTGDVTMITSVTIPANSTKGVNGNRIVGTFTQTTGGFGTLILYTAQNGVTPGGAEESIGNDFSNITFSGTGLIAGWDMVSNSNNVTRTVSNNTFANWNVTGSTSLNMAVLSVGGSGASTVSSNTIRNITRAGTSGAVVGLRLGGTGLTTATNNIIEGLSCGGAISPDIAGGIRINGPANVIGNRIHGIEVTGNFPLVGIDLVGSTVTSTTELSTTVGRNRISGLHATNAGNQVVVRGIRVEITGNGTTTNHRNVHIHNNLIGDLRASATGTTSANPAQVIGIDLLGTPTFNNRYVSFNTIYLNASSSGANNFGTSGVSHAGNGTATTNRLVMRNNIIVNTSTAKGASGRTVAFRQTNLGNYSNAAGLVSDRNLFHVGNGSMDFIFSNGSTHLQTLAAYQALGGLSPRDANSVSQMPAFRSVDATNYGFLHLDPTVQSLAEGGGVTITNPVALTTDFDGDTRQATPDIGADEICGPWGVAGPYTIATIYVDADGDGYGDPETAVGGTCGVPPPVGHVNNGDDCNDEDHTVWQSNLLYVDADDDGYDNGTEIVCYGADVPEGYSTGTLGTDCDDEDPNAWQNALLYVDADGDGYDNGTETVCYGADIPEGYSEETDGTDCDDDDPSAWQNTLLYVDADGDGYDNGTETVCHGADVPEGYSAGTLGADCEDTDGTVWQNTPLYVDTDGDGYDAGTETVCYGNVIPSGYSDETDGTDCNDSDANLTAEGQLCDAGPGFENGEVTAECLCVGTPIVTCTTDLVFETTAPEGSSLPTWQVFDAATDDLVTSGSGGTVPGDTPYPEPFCLADGDFYIVVNGVPAGATYTVRGADAPFVRIIDNKAPVQDEHQVGTFGNSGNAIQLPMSGARVLLLACDKYWWRAGDYLVANEDVDVKNVWDTTATNSPRRANTGYDFWFYDPNGTYSYVRQRRHNQADGYANVGSARTCHMRVNSTLHGWPTNLHIEDGLPLNVRVRTVVNGEPGPWGPACRFVRDEGLAACPPTTLWRVPETDPKYSCDGATRNWTTHTNQRIFAHPVSGASQYRFRFTNTNEGYDLTRIASTYYLNMGWNASVGAPLLAGSQYQVTVQANKGGTLGPDNNGWCMVGEPCTLTICDVQGNCGSGMIGGDQNSLPDGQVGEGSVVSLHLWPNPNRGDQLFVDLSVVEDVNTVTMEVFDLSGALVGARVLPVQYGFVNTVVELQGGLAAGTYLVRITAGSEQYNERLVIQP